MATLYKLSVAVSPQTEAATAALLEDTFHRSPCVESNLETGITTVSVFLEGAPSRAKLESVIPRFSVRKLRHENWAESWKRHFKPIEIGSKLLIKPGWSRRKPKAKQAVVILDPGLSFGTGQHPTTRFCLEQIVAFRRAERRQGLLDIGTGSGILAIAAVKLGYAPVDAFDVDEDAVRIALANAKRNRIARKIHLACKDLGRAPADSAAKYDIVCANLLSDLLLSERERLLHFLRPGGRLVLAGILKSQFGDIRQAYERSGLFLAASRTENEWQSGAFQGPE